MVPMGRVFRCSLLILWPLAMTLTAQAPSTCTGSEHDWKSLLRCRKQLQIEKASRYFNVDALIQELLKDPGFNRLGYEIQVSSGGTGRGIGSGARESGPNLLLVRVARKKFTTRFTVTLIEPQSKRALMSDDASSLGGEIEPDLAKILMRWIREANGESPKGKT